MNEELTKKIQSFEVELKDLLAKYELGLRPEMKPSISIIDMKNENLTPEQKPVDTDQKGGKN